MRPVPAPPWGIIAQRNNADAQTTLNAGFWMSDKPLVQQRLAADLADLALQIQGGAVGSTVDPGSTHAALDFIAGFWEAMCREWSGIDRLRCVRVDSCGEWGSS